MAKKTKSCETGTCDVSIEERDEAIDYGKKVASAGKVASGKNEIEVAVYERHGEKRISIERLFKTQKGEERRGKLGRVTPTEAKIIAGLLQKAAGLCALVLALVACSEPVPYVQNDAGAFPETDAAPETDADYVDEDGGLEVDAELAPDAGEPDAGVEADASDRIGCSRSHLVDTISTWTVSETTCSVDLVSITLELLASPSHEPDTCRARLEIVAECGEGDRWVTAGFSSPWTFNQGGSPARFEGICGGPTMLTCVPSYRETSDRLVLSCIAPGESCSITGERS